MCRIHFAASLLATASLMPTLAYAEEDADARTIVVSAKEPTARLLDFAGAATVIGAPELEGRQVQSLASLSYAAPNVSLDDIGTFKGVANFAMRGVGINSSIPSIDPAVGLFVDGVYMGINAGTVLDALDIAQVDLLRGPQGVAFGRNTTGGAVLVKTGDPDFEAWSGRTRLTLEGPVDGGRGAPLATMRAVISGPLSQGVAVRLAALHTTDGGYFRNGFNGGNHGKDETTVLRGAIALRPNDRLAITIKGEWSNSDGDGASTHNNGQHARDDFGIAINQEGFHHGLNRLVTARAEYELSESAALTNVFGWRKYRLRTRNDIDSSPATIFESDTLTAQEQWSNELYYAAGYGALAVTAGGYVFHQKLGYEETRKLAAMSYGGGRQSHDVFGLYAQADYTVADALTLTAGLRWSREEKRAKVTYVRPRAACSAVAGTCPVSGLNPATPGESNGFTDKQAWNSLSPRVALAYALSDAARAYASWTRGNRSGGYNLRITQPAAFEQVAAQLGSPAFDDERVDSFEVGFKWQPDGGRARLAAALFWNEIDDMQREVNVPSATSGLAQSVYNTADARTRGGEIEASVELGGGLTLSGNLGYTDAAYRRVFLDLNSDNLVDGADRALALPRAPKWTVGAGLVHDLPLGDAARLTTRANYQHRSRFAYTDNNWGYNSAADRLDASLTVALVEPAIAFTVYGRNLLDDLQFGGDTQLPFSGGPFSDGNNRPFDPRPAAGTFSPLAKGRTLGVEVAMEF